MCNRLELQAENIVFLSIIQNVSDGKVVTKGNQCWEIASESMVKNSSLWPHIFPLICGLLAADKMP